jgi:AraC family transcriptional regulator, transcriptional activator FtrA
MARAHRVAVLVFPPVSVFETAVACEVFGLDRRDAGVPSYDLRLCSYDEPPFPTNGGGGLSFDTPHRLATLRWADTIVLPGWPDPTTAVVPEPVRAELRRAHRRGARLASLCSGAFILAAAGLLRGRKATTHWMYARQLATQYPAIDVEPGVLYVGDDDVWTSAGTAAAIDLCLHFVRLDHGAEVANTVARRMVVPAHRDGGQAQYVETPVPERAGADGELGTTLDWAVNHLDQDLTVERLARRAAMSPRTFARRFKASTGTTPLQWLLTQRVVLAQRLLEGTDLPVELVARRAGFGSPATLRLHFARVVGTPPLAYRQVFRRAG